MKEFKKYIYLTCNSLRYCHRVIFSVIPHLMRNPVFSLFLDSCFHRNDIKRLKFFDFDTLRQRSQGCSLLLLVLVVFVSISGSAYGADNAADLGKKVYEERCLICHGEKGDGKGLVGALNRAERGGRVLNIQPRDFTVGVFKFRTTPTGCLPTDEDLLNIIENGISKSSMPSFKDISKEEKNAVKDYIKTFSARWEEEEPCKPIAMKKPKWVGKEDAIEKGKRVFKDMKCWECHGEDGKGKGPKADKLNDDWGKPIFPFNFTSGTLKRGTNPEDVYITFTTGLDGTGMPSYEDSLKEEERWQLVSYTLKLMRRVK